MSVSKNIVSPIDLTALHERGLVDTFLAAIRRSASGGLDGLE